VMSLPVVHCKICPAEDFGLIGRTSITRSRSLRTPVGFELSKLCHLNAGVGVVVSIPVALVKEASAAIKLALDPMRVEICPVFRMFQMLVEDVHRRGHVKCVVTTRTWASEGGLTSIFSEKLGCCLLLCCSVGSMILEHGVFQCIFKNFHVAWRELIDAALCSIRYVEVTQALHISQKGRMPKAHHHLVDRQVLSDRDQAWDAGNVRWKRVGP